MSSPVLIEQLDSAINVLLTDPDVAIPNVDPMVAELLGVGAELRAFPRPDFRSQLKASLMQGALAASVSAQPELRVLEAVAGRAQTLKQAPAQEENILPTLFGRGYGTYAVKRSNFALSVAAHGVALTLLLVFSVWMTNHRAQVNQETMKLVSPDVTEYTPVMPSAPHSLSGGGGGGDRDKTIAPEGRLPKLAMQQITPPEVAVRNEHPKLAIEPSVVMPPINFANSRLPNLGDPKSSVNGPPSNGTGADSGIGAGNGGGIGIGTGRGVGSGFGGGYGGGIFRPGVGGVSAPRLISKIDPEYSPEARQAKYQGTVILSLIVTPDGRAYGIRVARSLGMGLDEKAVEAVRQWHFEPALKDGRPVAVAVDVEVNFRLF